MAHLRHTVVPVKRAATDDGSGRGEGGLKWRAIGDVRRVPLPPILVAIIRTHIDLYGVHADGRVFTTENGGLPSHAWSDTWDRARDRAGLEGPIASTRPYDLRHTAGST